jgi:hypothetical protein
MPAKITALIDGESDRGVILILSAYLEEILGDVIRGSCISYDAAEKLLEYRQPAGDFSSKISICLAFGLIHETEAAALTSVRKIRNGAAHFDRKGEGFNVLFDSDRTIDLVGNLAEALNLNRPERTPEATRALFEICSRLLATKLMFRGIEAKKPDIPPTLKEVANKIREDAKGTEAGERISHLEGLLKSGQFEELSGYFKAIGKLLQEKLESGEVESHEE